LTSERRRWLVLAALAVLAVIVPFTVWRQTWFGRPLTDDEIGRYLDSPDRARKVQHALSQVSERIVGGDRGVERWYPQVVSLARHPLAPVRATAVWVMGQDNRSDAFHRALLERLQDSDVMVRRNAALSLVRFGDASGRAEILAMLQPYTVRAPQAGKASIALESGREISQGALLARIGKESNSPLEVRAPVSGRLAVVLIPDGTPVAEGEPLMVIHPASEHVWEALRALYLVGRPEDLPDVERCTRVIPEMPESVRRQAEYTARAIRMRSERSSIR
jgi:HEAT repeats